VRKCPYCDFNSHEVREEIPEKKYIRALVDDLEQDLPSVWGRTIETIFIGGGTPSLFSPDAISHLLGDIRARIPLKPGAEITLEANPGTIDQGHFEGFREAGILAKILPDLMVLGLEIEPFGGNTFVVKAVPVLLAAREVKPLIIEIVEKIVEIGAAPGLAEALDRCRMIMACHGAIRANQALTEKQIKGLLNQLDDCANPSHCPHGRPTWLRWELRTLEKSFKRIV